MISFEQARHQLSEQYKALPQAEVPVIGALGMVLAEHVRSMCDHPRFDNTAIDGYAFNFEEKRSQYELVGEVPAGARFERSLKPGECVRIFTGAMIPDGADTAVMQEFTERDGNIIKHADKGLRRGSNVRYQGEELKTGDVVLEKGTVINAQAIGLLVSCGIEHVKVVSKPRVAVVITGSEFTTVQQNTPGRIFNSNGPMLQAALLEVGIAAEFHQIEDDVDVLKKCLEQLLASTDMVITTGGVSVGDYDHIRPVAEALGVHTIFHKVAQKPGKPMYFGKKDDTLFFGLPGNPRSVMMGFWVHVLPMLHAMSGKQSQGLREGELPLGQDLRLKGDRTEMLAVKILDGMVHVARKQNSHMLSTLVDADGIGLVPAVQRELAVGDAIKVLSFT